MNSESPTDTIPSRFASKIPYRCIVNILRIYTRRAQSLRRRCRTLLYGNRSFKINHLYYRMNLRVWRFSLRKRKARSRGIQVREPQAARVTVLTDWLSFCFLSGLHLSFNFLFSFSATTAPLSFFLHDYFAVDIGFR